MILLCISSKKKKKNRSSRKRQFDHCFHGKIHRKAFNADTELLRLRLAFILAIIAKTIMLQRNSIHAISETITPLMLYLKQLR